MGFLDFLQGAGQYFDDRWNAVKQTFGDSFTKTLPEAWHNFYGGITTMAMANQPDRDSFWQGGRMFLDGTLGFGQTALGATLGTAFQAPVLHEGAWALDKVYRYGFAKPASWAFSDIAESAIAGDDARKRGDDPLSAYLGNLFSANELWGKNGMWSDNVANVTPGQAMMWAAGGQIGALNPGNADNPMAWLRSHDPRNVAGQAEYNGPDASFWLKYGSGSVDALSNVLVDPTVPFMAATKLAKLKFSNVATPDYIIRGGVDREISSPKFEKFYQAAKAAPSVEHLRERTMPGARFGGQVAPLLWSAAKIDDRQLFTDVYMVARGMDGGFKDAGVANDYSAADMVDKGRSSVGTEITAGQQYAPTEAPIGAWERIVTRAPGIASDMSRLFANWNIGEDALGLARGQGASKAISSLAMNDVDAFVAAVANRQGIWGQLPGRLVNEAQPGVSRLSDFRIGVHSWVMNQAPVAIGRPLAKALAVTLPSQGYTAFLDAQDATSLALRQFKANLERSGMAADRVEHWVSNWGAKGSPEGRSFVHESAEDEAIRLIGERHGLDPETISAALPQISRYRDVNKQILKQQRTYVTEAAARVGANLTEAGRSSEAAYIRELGKNLTAAEKKGNFGNEIIAVPNIDGHTNILQMQSSRRLPSNAPDVTKPLLLSQTERLIPTFDFRALDGALKWWKLAHRPEAGARGWTLSKIAKTHAAWDSLITAGDFANMIWKTSALLRPAQTPRNLADDVLRRYLLVGKLPMLMSMMPVPRRLYQNTRGRIGLVNEARAEAIAARQAAKTDTFVINSETGDHAPHNEPVAKSPDEYSDMGEAWANGAISLPDFVKWIETHYGAKGIEGNAMRAKVPVVVQRLIEARDEGRLDPTAFTRQRASDLKADRAYTRQHAAFVREQTAHDKENRARAKAGEPRLAPIFPPVKPPRESVKVSAVENSREFKRRLVQLYFDQQGRKTVFLNDKRIQPTVLDAEGDPMLGEDPVYMHPSTGDPLVSPDDARAMWLNKLIGNHQIKRGKAGVVGGSDAYRAGQMVVDPFTGLTPKSFDGTLDGYEIMYHHNLNDPLTTTGRISAKSSDLLEVFILNHIDDLMMPGNLLSLSIDPIGNVRMGVAKARPETRAAEPIKLSAKERRRNLKYEGIMDAGHTSIVIRRPPNGPNDVHSDIHVSAPFEGEEGQVFQNRVSAQSGQGSHNWLTGEFNPSRLLDKQGGWGTVQPHEPDYAKSWERAVNAQISGDAVAQQFLMGRTESDVIHWIENTREGTAYLHRMKHFGVNYVDHVRQIEGMVRTYVPHGDTPEHQYLAEAVLQKKARRADLDAVMPRLDQPEVHGATVAHVTGKGAIFDMITHGIDSAQRILSDLPTDKASRYPFFADAYRRHVTDLVRVAQHQLDKMDEAIPVEFMTNIERQARERALYDTKYNLYDVAQVNDLARLSRMIVPFSSAIMDSYIKYGRIVRQNPGAILQGLYYWQMFSRNDAVQDQDGNVLRVDGDGVDRWYQQDPDTKKMTEVTGQPGVGDQRYVQFRLPSVLGKVMGKTLYGVDHAPVFAINEKNFNVFIDLPASGPMAAVPINEFALSHPELGDAKLIKQFVLPFGPAADRTRAFVPANVRSAWDAFNGGDGDTAEGQAKAIYQAQLIAFGRGEIDHPPSIPQARAQAGMLKALRFMTTWVSPVSFQAVSPYQPYIDAYRQMSAVDPANADEKFLAQHGDEFYAVAMTVTRNNLGLRATQASDASFKRQQALISAYPSLAGLIVGADGGTFSKSVYEAQKTENLNAGTNQKVREVLSLDESVADLEKRKTWDQYTKMMDLVTAAQAQRGLTTLRGAAAQDLAAMRTAFVEKNKFWDDPNTGLQVHSPWYNDFMSVDHAAMASRIENMWQIVQDPKLQKRDDIRGLISYLSARDKMQQKMAANGVSSLDSSQANALATEWAATSFKLRESNPAFGQLWARWLSADDKLDGGA